MQSPFKFLDSYTKDDKDIFFGRDKEIEEIYHRSFESRLMLVYGVSGTGKSSLIHCGLANKINETDWLPLFIRRGSNIMESTIEVVMSASITPQKENFSNPSEFIRGVKSLYLDHYKPIFFIFDQFEELFIFGQKRERASFINIVKSLLDSDLQCRFIFIMREEYVACVTEFEKIIPNFFSNRVRIEKMSYSNALDVINEPCKIFNIALEEGFAEALLEKLSPGSSDVELTYLQVSLDKIFKLSLEYSESKDSHHQPAFTHKLLNDIGNVSDLLGSFLDEQLKELQEPGIGLAILKSFVSIKGTKKQLLKNEVSESVKPYRNDISQETLTEYLQKFVNIRILRDDDVTGKYELRHDSLASKIYEKITISEKELLEIYQFLDNALDSNRKRNTILNSNDLKYILPYEDRLLFNKEITALIELSKKEYYKIKTRIKRIALAGFISVLIFAWGALMVAYQIKYSNIVKILGLAVYTLWFLPLFLYYVGKTKENRTINILFLAFTIVFIGNTLLYNISIKNEILKPNLYSEQSYQSVLNKLKTGNDSLYYLEDIFRASNLSKDQNWSEYAKFGDIKERSDEIFNYLQDLKIEAIQFVEGQNSTAVEKNQIYLENIKRINDKVKTTEFFLGVNEDGKAIFLKEILSEYKDFLNLTVTGDPTIKFFINSFLNTKDLKVGDESIKWIDYNFKDISLGFVLLNLTKIQIDIKYAESRVLAYKLQKQNNLLQNTNH
jgi:hypothetical protein